MPLLLKLTRNGRNSASPSIAACALGRNSIALGLVGTITLERLAHDSLPATWVLYTTYRFNWTEAQNGFSLALVGVMYAIVAGGLTGMIIRRLGERRALMYGLLTGAFTFLLYGVASRGWILYLGIMIGSLGGVAVPAIQAIITRITPANEQGAMQGALASIQSLAAILGPLMAANLFGFFTSPRAPIHLPGAAFLLSALLVAAGAILAGLGSRKAVES